MEGRNLAPTQKQLKQWISNGYVHYKKMIILELKGQSKCVL